MFKTENDRPGAKSAKEKRIIEKSPVTPSLLAHIFVSKHMMHTPYYCLEDACNWQVCTRRFSTKKQSLGNFLMKKKLAKNSSLKDVSRK